MSSLSAINVDKPVEIIHPSNLPDANHDDLANGLVAIVDQSSGEEDVTKHIHMSLHSLTSGSHWIQSVIPGIERVAAEYHVGNFVVIRGASEPFFESMPLYARVGMHLTFYGKEQVRFLGNQRVEQLLYNQSVKQGVIYDSPDSARSIPSFIKTYSIQTEELLEPDLAKYRTFNEFFSRKLKLDARPVQDADNFQGICSAADCRLTVFSSVDLAKKFWIKGRHFDIPSLLNLPPSSPKLEPFHSASLGIFRLAPADYHRFHSPIDAEVMEIVNVPGQYYTVNPQAVNEPGLDIFTANTRSVLYLKHQVSGLPVGFVAIGALLVGSIIWTRGREIGSTVRKGDELGYFAYGGSTVVVVFPHGVIEFDEDLTMNSKKPIETLVKVGYSIGKTPIV